MNVVIFGCGRTGSTIGLQMSKEHQVTIVEQNPQALRRLGQRHNCKIVIGSGIDEDVLERAGIASADVLFCVTRGDNTNLMTAQIARLKYKVPKVCLKIADPHRAEAYRKLGYFCITPSALIGGMMLDWVLEKPYETIDAYNTLPEELQI